MPVSKNPQRLKRAVIKEELVVLAGDMPKAVILQQFIYWSERIRDFDQFIMEETARAEQYGQEIRMDPTNGWIYKKTTELAEETMLGLKETAMRTHIKYIVDKGWLSIRRNPDEKWDKTYQYRVNLLKIQLDLFKLGYALEGYKHPFSTADILAILKTESGANSEPRKSTLRTSFNEVRDSKNEVRTTESELHTSEKELRSSVNRGAIPETTSKITPETDYLNNCWEGIVDNLKTKISAQALATWILPIRADLQTKRLILNCSNDFATEWIKSRYIAQIIDSLPKKELTELIIQTEDSHNLEIIKLE
jgi:ATPase involved in DNA replication initiation